MLTIGLNAAPLLAPRTGVGRYILGLAHGLRRIAGTGAQREFMVRPLFAPAGILDAPGEAPDRPARPTLLHRARALVRRLPASYDLADLGRAAALLAQGRGLDVFHETNHAPPPTRLPLVLTIHDLCTILHPGTQDPARARFFARAMRARAGRARLVVTPTEAVARQVVEVLGLERGRVRAIPHGVDPLLARGPAPDAPREAPAVLRALGVQGPFALFVGTLEPRKGLPTLLDAWDQLPAALLRELPLVLAGAPERVDEALRARLARPRPGRVLQLGYTPPELLPALYRACAAFVLPSTYEGFGLPLLEALACGAPCVASDDPALVEVGGGAALHFRVGDASACARQLQAVLEGADVTRHLREAGPRRAAAFTWEASAAAHLRAWQEAARA